MAKHSPDLARLCVAMQRSRLSLRRYRDERREAVRQYVGSHWSEDGAREKVPMNLISLYTTIVGRNLIAKNPRVMLSTSDRGSKATVSAMQTWANKAIEEMRLANTLKRVVLDGLFSVGILKVALATPADSAHFSWALKAGEAFAERVDLDDFVFDIHARDFNEVGFVAHRYRVPLEVVRESKLYDSKPRKALQASTDSPYNLEGDERISRLGRGYYGSDEEEFEDFVDLWEVYLPRHRLVYTLADDHLTGATGAGANGVGEPLRVQPWIGPDTGPYHLLAYGIVPGNAMPKGPIQDLIDLHLTTNRLYRKLTDQAQRQKEVLLVQGGAMEDGERIQKANDGDIIRNDNPERAKVASYGAPNQQNFMFFQDALRQFSYMAGNLDMMGGLSPQSKTLGQDKMLEQNASHTVSDMQDQTVDFTAQVCKALCWFWYNDPFKVMKVSHALPGMPDMQIQRQVGPQQRMQGKFEDMDIKVDPYSMQHSTPQQRLASLKDIVTTVIMPMMQMLQQQGITFDLNTYLQKVGQYMDLPDLQDIITIQEPPQAEEQPGAAGGGGGAGGGMPQETTRNYNRVSTPGRTQRGMDAAMGAAMAGQSAGGAPAMNGAVQ